MRIIAGSARGRRLKTPRGKNTRPTSDRVREALFNILSPYIPGCSFLDLFAGSGAVGLEALSRGAARAVLVEADRTALAALRENVILTGFQDRAYILAREVKDALFYLGQRGDKFDIIYLDPPYYQNLVEPTLQQIETAAVLRDGGIAVAESAVRDLVPTEIGRLFRWREKEYGDTCLNFYLCRSS